MEILKSKENNGNFLAIKKKIKTINKVLENKYDFSNRKVDWWVKANFYYIYLIIRAITLLKPLYNAHPEELLFEYYK